VTSVTIRTQFRCSAPLSQVILLAVSGSVSTVPLPVRSSPLQFCSEVIDITVQEDRCIIAGDYFLGSQEGAPARGILYYPFALAEDLPFPDSVAVIDLATGQPIRYAQTRDGIQFPVQVAPPDSAAVRVTYTQRTPERRVRYILTTTQRWGRPLRSADFLIHIPRSLELTHISIAPDSVEHAGAWQIHWIHRSQFMPVCDLEFTWKEVE